MTRQMPSALGRNLRRIRLQRDLTLVGLAQAAGTHASTLSLVETGRRQALRLTNAVRLAAALGVTVEELLEERCPDGQK